MSKEWLNDYIGIPHKFEGRDREGLDCYGLCKIIYQEHLSINLPDWSTDPIDVSTKTKAFQDFLQRGEFTESDTPQDGDFVVCRRTRAAHHIGLYFYGGVVHSVDGTGVVYEPLRRFKEVYPNLVFGRWSPCLS